MFKNINNFINIHHPQRMLSKFRVNVLFTFLNISNYALNLSDLSLSLKHSVRPASCYVIVLSDLEFGRT
jgi:hypothetical protein